MVIFDVHDLQTQPVHLNATLGRFKSLGDDEYMEGVSLNGGTPFHTRKWS